MKADWAAAERAALARALVFPIGPQRGLAGERRSRNPGSSLELHDFRSYVPGDDVRHIDWNASQRTREPVLRVREAEVSPVAEVVVDLSGSMAVSEAKAARTLEVAALLLHTARKSGAAPRLVAIGPAVEKTFGSPALERLKLANCQGAQTLEAARRFASQTCGHRLVLSDFLFEADPRPLVRAFASNASMLTLVQVLDPTDLAPDLAPETQLLDVERADSLEHADVPAYLRRFESHQAQWKDAALSMRAGWLSLSAADELETVARGPLASLFVLGRR